MADLAYRRLARGEDLAASFNRRLRLGLCDVETATAAWALLEEGDAETQLKASIEALHSLGLGGSVRTLILIADAALLRWLALQPRDLTQMLVVRRIRVWFECPCWGCAWEIGDALQARGAVRIRRQIKDELRRLGREFDPNLEMAHAAARAIGSAGRVILELDGRGRIRPALYTRVLEHALEAGCEAEELLDRLRSALIPWLSELPPGEVS